MTIHGILLPTLQLYASSNIKLQPGFIYVHVSEGIFVTVIIGRVILEYINEKLLVSFFDFLSDILYLILYNINENIDNS